MSFNRKSMIAAILAVALVLVPLLGTVGAQDVGDEAKGTAEAMAFDFAVVRPLGLASIVAGTALFVVSLPFSALGGNTGEAFQKMVKDPVNFTFSRKLGDY